MGIRMTRLWRGRREDVACVDAEAMAWAIEEVLNAHETSPNRAKDPHDVADVLEGMAGYTPAATEILRRRGITGVVVVDDSRGTRYLVVCDRSVRRPPSRDLRSLLFPARGKLGSCGVENLAWRQAVLRDT